MPHKILVADDDAMIRRLYGCILERQDYTVVKAENGRLALKAFMNEVFDLIITDGIMPDMDGFELVQSLRTEQNYTGPILMVTAEDHHSVQALTEDGVTINAFLAKPFHPRDLIQTVAQLLNPAHLKDST